MAEKIFKGNVVSSGTAIGKLFILRDKEVQMDDGNIEESEIDNQITLLQVAVCKTFIEIYDLIDGFRGILSEEEDRIFDFYKEVLDDKSFFEEIINTINTKKIFASKAIYICIQKYIDEILQSNNEYMKQRIYDLKDIRKRIIKNIHGESSTGLEKVNNENIVAVKELTPAIATMLCKKSVQGVLAREGAGFFSHSSIILRSGGIPLLGEIEFEKIAECEGSITIIDSSSNLAIVNPSNLTIKNYKKQINDYKIIYSKNQKPVITTDGRSVTVLANINGVKDFKAAKALNMAGIGLVRTESLYLNYKKVPSEKRQYFIYSKIAKDMSEKPVVIRTADIGGDKLPDFLGINTESLERSSRGIKRSLEQKEEFITQIKCILRAAEKGNVKISFPMVSTGKELREAKKIMEEAAERLYKEYSYAAKKVSVGTMVETALAVENLDEILEEVDFISIGTNDLLQQFCKFDRKCSLLEKRAYLEPEFLKILQYCIDKAVINNKRVSVCGEMASDIEAVAILIGMGVHELSMNPVFSLNVSSFIRSISFKEVQEIAQKAVREKSIESVKSMLSKWSEGFKT